MSPGSDGVVSGGAAVPFPILSHTVFVGVNNSWGKAAAHRGCMERPIPPLFSGDLQGHLSPIHPPTLVEASLRGQQLQGGQTERTQAQALTRSAWLHKAGFSGKPA